jgi:hypothetical protein
MAHCIATNAGTMLFTLALVSWICGSYAVFANGHRRSFWLALFSGSVFCIFTFKEGYRPEGVAAMSILAAVIWIANNLDTIRAEQNIKAKAICCFLLALVVLFGGMIFFLTPLIPRLFTLGFESRRANPYGAWEAFREIPFFLAPVVSACLFITAMRLWKQLRKVRYARAPFSH